TPDGIRLFMEPVKEVESLRNRMREMKGVAVVSPGKDWLMPFTASGYGVLRYGPSTYMKMLINSPLCDNELTIDVSKVEQLVIRIGEQTVVYDAQKGRIALDNISAPLTVKDGILKLRILYDWTSIELFAQDGEVQIAECFVPKTGGSSRDLQEFYKGLTISTVGGEAKILNAKTWNMSSIWPKFY
ncbi:MAG: GH32 C-terminal domain-containing protein, partial [Planctomycetaceae bacterium]|nr:GH32 C-terminal domain-containing protein [Planctomycetaceae bacterium]